MPLEIKMRKRFFVYLAFIVLLITFFGCAEMYLIPPQQLDLYPDCNILSIILKDGRILEFQRADLQGDKILYIDKDGSSQTVLISDVTAVIVQ
jgi:hypothetical protein